MLYTKICKKPFKYVLKIDAQKIKKLGFLHPILYKPSQHKKFSLISTSVEFKFHNPWVVKCHEKDEGGVDVEQDEGIH